MTKSRVTILYITIETMQGQKNKSYRQNIGEENEIRRNMVKYIKTFE